MEFCQKIRPLGKKSISLYFALALATATGVSSAAAQSVTFDQILAQPNNLELNLRYARQEVASGRLQQAASALERMVLLEPDWDSARLFYGVVLYRLGDLEGAKRELRLLENRNLPPQQERDRVRYLALSENQSSPLRFSSRFSLGARYDSNPGFVGDDVGAASLNDEESDGAIIGGSKFRAELDIGNAGNYLFAETHSQINEFFDVDQADLITSNAKVGATFFGPNLIASPYVTGGVSYLQHDRFRTQFGGGAKISYSLSSQVELQLHGRAVYEDYEATSFSSVGDDRDGWLSSGSIGLQWRPTDKQKFVLTGLYADKDADFDGFSYRSVGVQARSLTLLGKGRFLSLQASYTDREYEEVDEFYTFTEPREDRRFYARAALGAPLETLFSNFDVELPEAISDVVLQVGVSYTNNNSNVALRDYDNLSGDILFTKRISF